MNGKPTIDPGRFQAALNERGWTRHKFVNVSGIDRAIIHRVWHGTSDVSFSTAARIADVLGVSLDWLACRDEFTIPKELVVDN